MPRTTDHWSNYDLPLVPRTNRFEVLSGAVSASMQKLTQSSGDDKSALLLSGKKRALPDMPVLTAFSCMAYVEDVLENYNERQC